MRNADAGAVVTRVGRSYKQHGIPAAFDAIVIGSGIGGLAAAALLARHGLRRVLVLERHSTPGGFTHTFTRRAFEWDVGVHYVGETRPGTELRRLFDHITDSELDWADMGEVYDRAVIAGETFDFVKGRPAFRERMIGYFPGEAQAIDTYLELIDRTCEPAASTSPRKPSPDRWPRPPGR